MPRTFTIRYGKPTTILRANVGICLPFQNHVAPQQQVSVYQYKGIWDTGATASVITGRVVHDLGLTPTEEVKVYHAGGTIIARVYIVNIILGDDVMVSDIEVSEAELSDADVPLDKQFDVLIGMDVIGAGDFAITNYRKRTTLSFRVPSKEEIDFMAKKHRNT